MKRFIEMFLLAVALLLSGCRSEEKAPESVGVEENEVIRAVLSKQWNEKGGDSYAFAKDGTGNISGEDFTYSCGFDVENRIVLKIVMDDTKEERNYYVTTDDTGYGLLLDAAGEGDDLYLLQADMEILEMTDERAAGLIGEWADKSDNRYIMGEDRTMVIKGKSGSESAGTYSAAQRRADGALILTLVFEGNTLDFNYELSKDNGKLILSAPGTETVHEWLEIAE